MAYPHGHEVSARFHKSLLNLLVYDAKTNARIVSGGGHLANSSGANIVNARNEIVDAFLEHHDADWLWFVDTDMTFEPDVLDRMVKAAHPEKRPILGALCFAWLNGNEASPTIYGFSPDNKVVRYFDYPRDQCIQVGATGTGCVLIHRSVLEKLRELHPKPWPYFAESTLGHLPVGEDITFCIRAGQAGFPVFVDTSIKIGHEKPFIVDEDLFNAQRRWADAQPDVPTFVVIPVRDRHDMTANLIEQLEGYADIFVFDNDSDVPPPDEWNAIPAKYETISQMWNDGLHRAEEAAKAAGHDEWNVAILNNDLEVPPGFLRTLANGLRLRDDFWIAYPNWHGADIPEGNAVITSSNEGTGRTLSGWAFIVRGETGLRVDERFEWWYGDDDLQLQVESQGKQVVCVGVTCKHLEPNKSSQTPEKQAIIAKDRERFLEKWGAFLEKRLAS